MKGKMITKIFLLIVALIVIAYDVWVIVVHGKAASISWFVITDLKRDFPLVNDGFFILMGHLFWRMRTPESEMDERLKAKDKRIKELERQLQNVQGGS